MSLMKKSLLLAGVLAGTLALPARADPSVSIVIGAPPPPPAFEVIPAPVAGYVWSPGYWGWHAHRHVWVPGRYVVARPGYAWVGPHWVPHGHHWRLAHGHWAPHGHHLHHRVHPGRGHAWGHYKHHR